MRGCEGSCSRINCPERLGYGYGFEESDVTLMDVFRRSDDLDEEVMRQQIGAMFLDNDGIRDVFDGFCSDTPQTTIEILPPRPQPPMEVEAPLWVNCEYVDGLTSQMDCWVEEGAEGGTWILTP